MKICYFTATGNSLYVARRIGGELLSIPRLMKTGETEIADEAVGIVCPVYAGEMPRMVRDFLGCAHIKTDYFFFIYTFGMSKTVAVPNAVTAARAAGLTPAYIAAVKMADNYLPGFEAQRQKDTAAKKNIEGQIDRVCRAIAARERRVRRVGPLCKLGMAAVHGTMARALLRGDAAQKYSVTDACVRCGICAKVCPADNITVEERVQFSNRCQVCYACLHNCPKNAIHLKNEKSAARFRNEHITLRDIIAANA